MSKKIAVLVGSLRKDSYTGQIASAIVPLLPSGYESKIIKIDDLPFYNPDLDGDNAPQAWLRFREAMAECVGIIFITPEYNRSIPAVLKNALDVGSRPAGKAILNDKPATIISASPGDIGGYGANHHLRQIAIGTNINVLPNPQVYLSNVSTLIKNGQFTNEDTADFIKKMLAKFTDWITRLD